MAKQPGEQELPRPISAAEREARKAFRELDAKAAMTDHAIAEQAFSKNRERLKAERLAREALEASPPKKKAKSGPKAKR